MKRCQFVFLVFLLFTPLLEGCWNQEELTDLALVMAVGIDKGKNNHGYQLTFEIVNPGNVASSFMGGGQGSPVAVYKSTGETLLEASRKASKELSRKIYYAHTSAVVISEQIAKEGLLDIFDILDRDPVFRTTTQVFIARKASAENVVSTLTILDKLPVNKMVKSLNVTEKILGENMKVTVDDFISSVVSNGKEPIANGIVLPGNKSQGKKMSNIESDMPTVIIKVNGTAIFREGKLIGWIGGRNARGIVWVLGKVKGTDVHVDWQGKKNAVGVIIKRSNVKVTPKLKNGKPIIDVQIRTEGDIEEVNTAVDVASPKYINELEQLVEQKIQNEVNQSIKKVQSRKSDILGFGEMIHRENPKMWRKLKNNWNQEFASMEVNVKTYAYIRRNGIRTKPFWSNMNK